MFCPKCGKENLHQKEDRLQCDICKYTFAIQETQTKETATTQANKITKTLVNNTTQTKEIIAQNNNFSDIKNSENKILEKTQIKKRKRPRSIRPINKELLKTRRLQAAKQKKPNYIWVWISALLFLGITIIGFAMWQVFGSKTNTKKIKHFQEKYTHLLSLSLEELADLPNEKINLATVALKIAAQDLQDTHKQKVNIKKVLQKIDKLAKHIQKRIKNSMLPEEVISTIAHKLYDQEKFQTSQNPWDPSNLYLNLIFEGKQGYCLGFTQLWLSLSERLKWRGKTLPIHGVYAPSHIFCRWQSKQKYINIETLHTNYSDNAEKQKTSQTKAIAARDFSDKFYKESYYITKEAIKNKVYLKSCDKKAVISGIYSNRAYLQIDKLQYTKTQKEYSNIRKKAYKDINNALKWYPKNILAIHNKTNMLLNDGKYDDAIKLGEQLIKLNPNSNNLSILSRIYASKGLYKTAFFYIEKALKIKSTQESSTWAALFRKTSFYYEQDKYAELLAFCHKITSENPALQILLVSFQIKALIKIKRHDKAMALAYLLHKHRPDEKIYKLNIAYVYMHTDEWEKAKTIYDKILWTQKSNIDALYGLGYYWHLHKNSPKKAIEYFENVLKIEPWNKDSIQSLKEAQQKQKNINIEKKNE